MKLIILHGLGQTPDHWKNVVRTLKGQTECRVPDLSSMLRQPSANYSTLLKSLEAHLSKEQSPVHLCGLSLGAILAMDYAIKHPEKVHSLILIATQLKMPKALLGFQNLIFRFMPASAFTESGLSKSEMISLCRSMKNLDFTYSISGITCPVLVICGQKDRTNLKQAQTLTEQVPSATFREIENAGHEVNIDAPEVLSRVILGYLSKTDQLLLNQ